MVRKNEKDSMSLQSLLIVSNPRTIYFHYEFATQISEHMGTSYINSYPLCINISVSERETWERVTKLGEGFDVIFTWKFNRKFENLINDQPFKFIIFFTTKKFKQPLDYYLNFPSIYLTQSVFHRQLEMLCIICSTTKILPNFKILREIEKFWLILNLDFGGEFKAKEIKEREIFVQAYQIQIEYKPCSKPSNLRTEVPRGNRIFCVLSIFRQKFNMSSQVYGSPRFTPEPVYTTPKIQVEGEVNYLPYNKSLSRSRAYFQKSRWCYVSGAVDNSEWLEYMIMLTRTKYFNVQALVQPYHFLSWLLALFSAVIIIIILKIKRASSPEMWTFAQVLEQDSGLRFKKEAKITIGVVVIFWLTFTLLLRNEYTSNLTSYLMAGPSLNIPKSLREIHAKNIPVLEIFRNKFNFDYETNLLFKTQPNGQHRPYSLFVELITGAEKEAILSDYEMRQIYQRLFRTYISSIDIEVILGLLEQQELFDLGNMRKTKAHGELLSFPRISALVNTRDNLEIIATIIKYLTQGNRNFYRDFGRVVNKTLGSQQIWYFSRKFYASTMARCITFLYESGIYGWWTKDDKLLRKSIRYHRFLRSLDQLIAEKFGNKSTVLRKENSLDSLKNMLSARTSVFYQYLMGNSENSFSNPEGDVTDGWEPISYQAFVIVASISYVLLSIALVVFLIERATFRRH
ncbi:unnamed protein product [Orchesella dallaii]|uniref:Uncharacterized protein n=1 Tax=Orchesella dallaii TaxID=48710 RepID=A0ABP1R0H2_9HEXA